MADVGDVVSALTSIADGAYLDIRPGASANWKIHNIYHQSTIDIEFYDGTNSLVFVDCETGIGVYAYYSFGCDNTRRIRVRNMDGAAAKLIGYDGIVTK